MIWPLAFTSRGAKVELWTLLSTQVRHNHNRPNLQRPLPLHYKRARMLQVVRPQYPPRLRVCDKIKAEETKTEGLVCATATPTGIEKNGYAQFLARKMRQMFHTHPMIAIMHMNSLTGHDFLKEARASFHSRMFGVQRLPALSPLRNMKKAGESQGISRNEFISEIGIQARGILFDAKFDMTIENRVGRAICRTALEGTKFQPALHLLETRCSVGYCTTTDVSKLLKLLKKTPQYILIGLIMEDRLLHRADIKAFAKLPNITTLYSNLSRTLTLASSNISNNLQANQIVLSRSLAQHSSSADS